MGLLLSEIWEVTVKMSNMHDDQLLQLKSSSVNICIYRTPPSDNVSLPFSFSLFPKLWIFKAQFRMLIAQLHLI